MKSALSRVLTNPMVCISVVYLLFPTDLVADALPVVGTADDLIIMVVTMFLQEYFTVKRQNKQ